MLKILLTISNLNILILNFDVKDEERISFPEKFKRLTRLYIFKKIS